MVVYRDTIAESSAAEIEGVRMPPVPLSVDEQVLFLEFQERRERISTERSEELAEILTRFLKESGALMPMDKRTGASVPYPLDVL